MAARWSAVARGHPSRRPLRGAPQGSHALRSAHQRRIDGSRAIRPALAALRYLENAKAAAL